MGVENSIDFQQHRIKYMCQHILDQSEKMGLCKRKFLKFIGDKLSQLADQIDKGEIPDERKEYSFEEMVKAVIKHKGEYEGVAVDSRWPEVRWKAHPRFAHVSRFLDTEPDSEIMIEDLNCKYHLVPPK